MRTFYTESEMAKRLQEARKLGFRLPKGSERLPVSVWCRAANGVGPGAWSRMARKISTRLQPFAGLAADSHDLAYCHPDKTRKNFNEANDNFYFNIRQDIYANTWRISLIRVLALRAAWIEYQAVHLGGWEAFVNGFVILELGDTEPEGPETQET